VCFGGINFTNAPCVVAPIIVFCPHKPIQSNTMDTIKTIANHVKRLPLPLQTQVLDFEAIHIQPILGCLKTGSD